MGSSHSIHNELPIVNKQHSGSSMVDDTRRIHHGPREVTCPYNYDIEIFMVIQNDGSEAVGE